MSLLICGLALFLGVHLLPTLPGVRANVVGVLGTNRYKGVFALASAAGLALIGFGFARSGDPVPWFTPFPVAVALAPYAMVVSFILLAAANLRGYLRRRLQHPMLLGVIVWSTVHLLANGDRAGTLLFGAFLGWAIIDLASAIRRHAVKVFEPEARFDAMAVAGGLVTALAVMLLHRTLFGVAVVPFGV